MQPSIGYMRALAFIYDNFDNFPLWVQKLAPSQLTQLARMLNEWAASDIAPSRISTLEETQKREVIRAVIAYQGDLRAAAKALEIGKTTIYRLLHRWGLSKAEWQLVVQAKALADGTSPVGNQNFNALATAAAASLSTPGSLISREPLAAVHNCDVERGE